MKDIIIFQGQITSSFFQNEIEYIKKYFNILAIVSYEQDETEAKKILLKFGLEDIQHFNLKSSKIGILKSAFYHKPESLKDEFLRECFCKKHAILRSMYALYYFEYARRVYDVLKEINVDNTSNLVLYSFWMSKSAYAMMFANEYLYCGNAKMICRAHGYDLYEERNKINYLPFRRLCAEKIDNIYFISRDGMSYFANRYKERDNLHVSYLGVENPRNIIKTLYDKNEICIVSCSMVVGVKRLDIMVNLLSKLNGLPIKWVHIGDGDLMGNIKALAREKLADSTIKYEFVGWLDNSRVLEKMEEVDADYFINTSDSEGLPVSMMEALSFGIPIIARNVGGIKEIVNETTGILIQDYEKEISLIYHYVESRITNFEKYKQYVNSCREQWKTNFSAKTNYQSLFETES